MATDEGGYDVLPRPGGGEDPGSRAVDILELVRGIVGGPERESILIMQTGGDEGVN